MTIDINGDVIDSITIDGQNVKKVTADGEVVFTGGPDIPDSALTQDLVAWYRFENGDARDYTATLDATFADSIAYDGTVNGATFQSSGGVTDFENGANSGAFDFDGSNDKIATASIPFNTDSITVSLWLNMDDTNGGRYIGRNINDDFRTLLIANNGAGTTEFLLGDGSSFDGFRASFDPPVGTYTHLAMTGDNGSLAAYIDGSQVGTSTYPVTTLTAELGIGETVDRNFTNGQIDDVRIYNRALTASEISDIYNSTKPDSGLFLDSWSDNKLTSRDDYFTTEYPGSEPSSSIYSNPKRPEWVTKSGSPTAANQRLELPVGSSTNQVVSASASEFTTGTIEFTFQQTGTSFLNYNIDFHFLVQGSSDGDPSYRWNMKTGGNGFSLQKRESTGDTTLISGNSVGDTSEHDVRIERPDDSTIECYLDGSLVGSATDSTFTSGQSMVFRSNQPNQVNVDNFRVY